MLGLRVVSEDRHPAAVVQQQGREQTDERRLPGAVLAQDREGLALQHRERDAVEGGDPVPLASESPASFTADELLAEVDDLDRRHGAVAARLRRDRDLFCVQHRCSFAYVNGPTGGAREPRSSGGARGAGEAGQAVRSNIRSTRLAAAPAVRQRSYSGSKPWISHSGSPVCDACRPCAVICFVSGYSTTSGLTRLPTTK